MYLQSPTGVQRLVPKGREPPKQDKPSRNERTSHRGDRRDHLRPVSHVLPRQPKGQHHSYPWDSRATPRRSSRRGNPFQARAAEPNTGGQGRILTFAYGPRTSEEAPTPGINRYRPVQTRTLGHG